MADQENLGGESGGKLVLKRSELAILRKFASKYPIVEGERQEAVDCVMDVIRTAKGLRHKLGAVKTLASLDKVNHDEIALYLQATKGMNPDLQPKSGDTINILNLTVLTDGQLTELDRAIAIATGGGPSLEAENRNGEVSP